MNPLFKRRLSVVLGFLLIAGGVVTCNKLVGSRKSPDRRPDAVEARAVRTIVADNGPVPIAIPVTGRVRATDRMLVNAEVGGTLLRSGKAFREGVTFRKGEVLVRIDDAEVRAQVNAQQSAFLRSLVQLVPDLRYDLPEVAAKWEAYLRAVPVDGLLPQLPGMDSEQERNYLAGRGVLDQYYGIRALYERMARYVITAPFDGVVVSAAAEPGTIVNPGMRLGEFIAPGALELETAIPASELPLVKLGDTLRLSSTEGPGHWVGTLHRVGEHIDPATQTVKLFVDVRGEGLRDGMYMSGTIEAGTLADAIAVPRSALLTGQGLYIVQDSLLRRTTVEVAHEGVEDAVVRGISDGAVVVVDRLSGAYEGLRVAPVPMN